MRSKSIVLVALAISCGVVAAIGISQLMDVRNRDADMGERQPVFVAMADINPNEELTAQNIKVEEWPQAIVPAGALTKLEDVEGKRCRMKVYAGEPILASKLLGANESIGAAKDIPPGYRVSHVTVDGAAGSNNLILPGDRVDVVVFRNIGSNDLKATASKIVLQDIKVFAVDTHTETEFSKTKSDQTEPMTAKTISLLVTPRQAEILHAAKEMSGAISLVLRNPDDDTHYTSDGATIADIFGPDEHADRESEGSDKDTGGDNLTSWLNGQQGAGTPAPPVPNLPQPSGPHGKMIVMYGSELMQVDFPSDGGLPTNPLAKDSFSPGIVPGTQLTGGTGAAAGPSDTGSAGGDESAPAGTGNDGAASAPPVPHPPGEFIEDEPTDRSGGTTEDNATDKGGN